MGYRRIFLKLEDKSEKLTKVQDIFDNLAFRKCHFHFLNCHKLANCASNGVADRLLGSLLQNQLTEVPRYSATFQLPGCEVPRWFFCRSVGNNAIRQMKSGWFDDSFRGFVVCAVFEDIRLGNSTSSYYAITFSTKFVTQRQSCRITHITSFSFCPINSKHLLISYISRRTNPWDAELCQLQLQFYCHNPDVRVISCGIHPVYMGGVKGPNDVSDDHWSSSVNFRLNIIPSRLELPAVGDGCWMKRDHDFPCSIGNGLKWIANNSFNEEAHLKRFKEL